MRKFVKHVRQSSYVEHRQNHIHTAVSVGVLQLKQRLSFGSSVKAELKSELNLKAQQKSSNPLGFLCLHFLLPSFL